jgi:hypothetical protein
MLGMAATSGNPNVCIHKEAYSDTKDFQSIGENEW